MCQNSDPGRTTPAARRIFIAGQRNLEKFWKRAKSDSNRAPGTASILNEREGRPGTAWNAAVSYRYGGVCMIPD